LARLISRLGSRRIVFDPLAARYETKILDWKRKPEGSPSARWNKFIDRRAFRSSDFVLADTSAHKEYYCREYGVDPARVAVLPVGFDDRIFSKARSSVRPSDQAPELPFRVFFFGSFLPLHGVAEIIEAARLVASAEPAVSFCFVGSGQTLASVRARALQLGLANVEFEGWLSQTELAGRVSRAAHVCLGIFGRTEKADRVVPHKIFQSMALGKPVITARTPAVEEFFVDRENILLCRREDPRSLADAVVELKRDRALRERIARSGSELVWQQYHPAALGSVLKSILEKAVSGDYEA
jgi:glycosyltransferase involved in cell wall biosynthesis